MYYVRVLTLRSTTAGTPASADPAGYYFAPWVRFLPYLHGLLIGFVLWKLKEKELRMHWTVAILGWLLAAAVALLVLFGLHGIRSTNYLNVPSYSQAEAVFYEGFAKTAWSASLAWVAIACHKGYGGVINKFLSWGVFQPFAKMSYMAYLFHMGVIWSFAWSRTYSLPNGYWPQVLFSCENLPQSENQTSNLSAVLLLHRHHRHHLRRRFCCNSDV